MDAAEFCPEGFFVRVYLQLSYISSYVDVSAVASSLLILGRDQPSNI